MPPTLNRLLERLKPWSVKLYCTDDYAPYDALLPVGRHYIGKDETVAIERVNSRLRHWFARFRRRTCVVSKALEMVDATIALFAAYHVNRTATKLTLPLTVNIGDAAGFLNVPKIKGNHTAMKSGMVCAEAVFEHLVSDARGGR